MSYLPSIQSLSVSAPNWKLHALPFVPGSAIVVDEAVKDMGSTPTWRLRPGNVLVKRSATETYVAANDPTGDRNTPPTVLALAPADATWGGTTITATIEGGVPILVTLAPTDTTDALVATRLNGTPAFAGQLLADTVSTGIRIRSLRAGRATWIFVVSSLAAAFGALGATAIGTDADYRVLEDFCDLEDNTGAPVPGIGSTSLAAYYATASLVNLTAEAQIVLSRNGSIFG